jgi:hypothetical protein
LLTQVGGEVVQEVFQVALGLVLAILAVFFAVAALVAAFAVLGAVLVFRLTALRVLLIQQTWCKKLVFVHSRHNGT